MFVFCSCSLFLDNVVAVWDVRRPYIPFASFTEHSDDVTGQCTPPMYSVLHQCTVYSTNVQCIYIQYRCVSV